MVVTTIFLHHPYHNINNFDNTDTITPSPSTSHKTNTVSITLVITNCPNGWECPNRWASNDNLINNNESTTTPSPSTITSTSTPSTKSWRNVLEQHKKRRHRKERDKKAKELERKVHALQQQLRENEEKQKQKDKYTTELHKSLKRCRLLETKKLKQLNDLIKEKEQASKERWRYMKGNKQFNKNYKHKMNEVLKLSADNWLSEKKKLNQLDVLI